MSCQCSSRPPGKQVAQRCSRGRAADSRFCARLATSSALGTVHHAIGFPNGLFCAPALLMHAPDEGRVREWRIAGKLTQLSSPGLHSVCRATPQFAPPQAPQPDAMVLAAAMAAPVAARTVQHSFKARQQRAHRSVLAERRGRSQLRRLGRLTGRPHAWDDSALLLDWRWAGPRYGCGQHSRRRPPLQPGPPRLPASQAGGARRGRARGHRPAGGAEQPGSGELK